MDDRLLADPEDPYPEGIDGPTVEVPSVDVPSVSAEDVRDSPILRLFVLQVVVWNLVLLAVSLGGMLIYFEGNWETGGRLVAAGAVLALYGAYRWPRGGGDEQAADES